MKTTLCFRGCGNHRETNWVRLQLLYYAINFFNRRNSRWDGDSNNNDNLERISLQAKARVLR
ncbi:MAG: hypothetical protein HYR66_17885 [Sphingobacteriales bacterium]|nr:hypothetical protein [Sphingobacteriales bacterium]MBI3720069.1 hypothetical protein [Sphingobacteriales bacterium]